MVDTTSKIPLIDEPKLFLKQTILWEGEIELKTLRYLIHVIFEHLMPAFTLRPYAY